MRTPYRINVSANGSAERSNFSGAVRPQTRTAYAIPNARAGVGYSHFFHLKNRYGSTAANSIIKSAIG